MSEVYANGHEVSAKADSNKSMAAMPDVCMSPPSPPAGPIPIPYPNFAVGSDTADGTKTVQVGGKEVGIKNSSSYKKSKGNEAATKSFGMNVISHNISGKMKHAAWSMDVKFEGENAIRQLDITTHNHTNAGGGGTTGNGGRAKKVARKTTCEKLEIANQEAVADKRPKAQDVAPGTTVATAHHRPRGPGSGLQVSASSHMSDMANEDGWSKGYKTGGGKYKQSAMCDEAKEELDGLYTDRGRGKHQSPMCHAESRIIETIFTESASAAGVLTLRIAWKPSGSTRTIPKPCETCRKMLCAVQKHCGITVMICSNPKKPPKKLKCS